MKSIIIKLVLFAVIILLGFLVFRSITQPLDFLKEKKHRDLEVIQRLKDIRNVQLFYKNAKGSYTSSFDSLTAFLSSGEIPVIKLIPDPLDTTFTRTIADTMGYVKVSDSLFSGRKNFKVSDLRFIPFSGGVMFEMGAGDMERGGVKVSVFEAKAAYKIYLKGLDEQRVNNLVASEKALERFPGLKVGSLTEPSTDGNWE